MRPRETAHWRNVGSLQAQKRWSQALGAAPSVDWGALETTSVPTREQRRLVEEGFESHWHEYARVKKLTERIANGASVAVSELRIQRTIHSATGLHNLEGEPIRELETVRVALSELCGLGADDYLTADQAVSYFGALEEILATVIVARELGLVLDPFPCGDFLEVPAEYRRALQVAQDEAAADEDLDDAFDSLETVADGPEIESDPSTEADPETDKKEDEKDSLWGDPSDSMWPSSF